MINRQRPLSTSNQSYDYQWQVLLPGLAGVLILNQSYNYDWERLLSGQLMTANEETIHIPMTRQGHYESYS